MLAIPGGPVANPAEDAVPLRALLPAHQEPHPALAGVSKWAVDPQGAADPQILHCILTAAAGSLTPGFSAWCGAEHPWDLPRQEHPSTRCPCPIGSTRAPAVTQVAKGDTRCPTDVPSSPFFCWDWERCSRGRAPCQPSSHPPSPPLQSTPLTFIFSLLYPWGARVQGAANARV